MISTIFISHKTEDKKIADGIIEFLRSNGYPAEWLFLDSDAHSGLLVGQKWQEALYAKLQDCVCLVVVGTSKWTTSKWCFAEAFIAKNRNIPIIPLKCDEEADLTFLSEYQAVQNFKLDSANMSRLLEILSQNELDPPSDGKKLSSGWTHESPELSVQEQRDLLKEVSKQIDRLQPDRLTRRVAVSILAIMLATIISLPTYLFYGDAIEKWWNPPKTLDLSTPEFIKAVLDPTKHHDLKDKKVKLIGIPNKKYSASFPRIDLDTIVQVNINSMANNEAIPETLDLEALYFSGIVYSINSIEASGKILERDVYMVDVELTPRK